MGNITISFWYEVSCTCGDYDNVSMFIDRLDKSTHFSLVQRDYILDHLVKLPILEFIGFSSISISIFSDCDSIFTHLCWKDILVNFGYMSTLLQFVLFRRQVDCSEELLGCWNLVVIINSSITRQLHHWMDRYRWWLNILEVVFVVWWQAINIDILNFKFDELVLTLKFLSVLLAFLTWFLAQSVRNLR